MNKTYFVVLCASLLSMQFIQTQTLQGISFFSPRPQTSNAARELVDDQQFMYTRMVKKSHMASGYVAYHQSLQAEKTADIVFGNDILTISGSQVDNREHDALLADYFGLSPAFKSSVQISPKIRSLVVPLTAYVDLGDYVNHMYIRVSAPFVWNQSNLVFKETVINTGDTALFPEDYMGASEITPPYKNFTQALQGGSTFGAINEPLRYGKLGCKQSTKKLANITIDLGWQWILDDARHCGFRIRTVTPNSTRPDATFLFEPIAGNQKHWELGFGLDGHTRIWEKDGTQELSIYSSIFVTHLFKARQRRSFDLKAQGFWSRYMLAKEFDATGAFTGNVVPLINRTTLECNVRASLQFDGALMFAYNYNTFSFNAGYNAWIRTREKITLRECLAKNTYGLKGIQNVVDDADQPSRATQSTATIFGNTFAMQDDVVDPSSPQFINPDDVNVKSARSPVVFTHKLFASFGHTGGTMHKGHHTQPFVGVGGEIEFQGINENNNEVITTDKNTMSQWALWIRAGILFA